MTHVSTHYVDPYNTVLESVRREVRVEAVRREESLEVSEDVDDLVELRREQGAIEARLRELEGGGEWEVEEDVAEETFRDVAAGHRERMRAYDDLLAAQENAGLTMVSTSVGSPYTSVHEDFQKRRETNLVVRPFSFETRERTKKGRPSVRGEVKKREQHIRESQVTSQVCYPNGAKPEFRANPVPPSTFMNKYEMMQLEEEDKRQRNKEKAIEKHKARSYTPNPMKMGYISEPLRKTAYVPIVEKMQGFKIKVKPVPKSVLEPRWHKLAEAEVLRKMDVKEAARYKLAECEAYAPNVAKGGERRSRSVVGQGLNSQCRFKPVINKGMPDFSRCREKEAVEKVWKEEPRKTEVKEFKLSKNTSKPVYSIKHEISVEDATLPERRWPYLNPRTAPERKEPPRSNPPPARYTKSANILHLERSKEIVRKEEERKRVEEEEEAVAKRKKDVAKMLKRYEAEPEGGSLVESEEKPEPKWKSTTRMWKLDQQQMLTRISRQKPVWLRGPERQQEEAAHRAHAEEVASKAPAPGSDSGSEPGTPTQPTTAAAAAADPTPKKSKKKKSTDGSDSDSSSSSSSDSYSD